MFLRKFIFLFISLILLQCKETTESGKNTNSSAKDTGVSTYYNYLKEYKSNDFPEDIRSDVEISKKIAEAELISIFMKPEKYGSSKIYLDNISYDKIKFIINEDDELRMKFGKYINKNKRK
jgi:hypothetical protein